MTALVERPFALIEVPISARTKKAVGGPGFALSYGTPAADRSDLESALAKLADQDSSLTYWSCETSGAFMIGGIDELQLDTAILALKQALAHEIDLGPPQVAYRERLSRRVEIDETYRKLTGGVVRFASVKIVFEPNTLGAGSSFHALMIDGSVPADHISGIEKGLQSVMGSGILANFPIIDLKATLIDGAFHDTDSSALAFEICARIAFRRALKDGGSILLEPIMKVEVSTPEDYVGSITGDLGGRRGQVQGVETRDNVVAVTATVPLANMFGYVSQLRSFSQGRATFTMQFSYYAVVPPQRPEPFPPAVGMRA